MDVFNGQVMVKISTDGKFLVSGKLNFADNNISVTAKLYANLSKIASGEATVLFLAQNLFRKLASDRSHRTPIDARHAAESDL